MPSATLHITHVELLSQDPLLPRPFREAMTQELTCARLGAVLVDLPFYTNIVKMMLGYWLEMPAEMCPFAQVMHRYHPDLFTWHFLGEVHQDGRGVLGIERLNISLDSLSPRTYEVIGRRDRFNQVWRALTAADALGFVLKINLVVLPGLNDGELADFVALTRDRDWTVRFIEPMPFGDRSGWGLAATNADGGGQPVITGDEIHRRLAAAYSLRRLTGRPGAVAELYQVAGHRGRIGIIRGHSRTFCASCSRLRLSAQGLVRTCLYGPPVLDLKQMLREGASAGQLATAVQAAVHGRAVDGIAAAATGVTECGCLASMAAIGG